MTAIRTLLAVGFATLGTAAANAADASFVVSNPSDVTIKYQVKWGTGEWKAYTVEAGSRRYHACALDDDGDAPTPTIRFDCVAGDDAITWKTYRAETRTVSDRWQGQKYTFRYSADGKNLDLYK